MFIDKQKLERDYFEELTKIGNLLDTLKIDYCVFGSYALLAYNIKTRQSDCSIVVLAENKLKVLEVIFKLNYTIFYAKDNVVKIKKASKYGDVLFDIIFATPIDKDISINYKSKNIIVPAKIFEQERKEVAGLNLGKGGRGYFKVAPLEELYLSKLNSTDEADILDLEMIKASGKIDLEKLLKLLEKNGMV